VFQLKFFNFQLIAKLKAVFDRFDNKQDGRIDGERVEQALLYMNRDITPTKVPIPDITL
jgi:Ca2+-binding EF-hand superfamily protein